jgi:hypothetical protein
MAGLARTRAHARRNVHDEYWRTSRSKDQVLRFLIVTHLADAFSGLASVEQVTRCHALAPGGRVAP